MAKALDNSVRQKQERAAPGWGSRMSDHVAFALLVYTALQIFVTMLVLKSNHDSILPYFALVVLVFAIIPACWLFEKRWKELPAELDHDPRLAGVFARDRAILWSAAILLPLGITGLIKGMSVLLA